MSRHDGAAVREVVDAALAEGRTALTAPEAKRIADAYGIPVPAEALAESVDEAVAFADRIGFPVVLKIVSPDIVHKTDAGGVRVGLASAAEVRGAFTAIVANARTYDAEARIQGVQVQQMVPAGTEVIVGAVTDPTFGKVVAFGLGGVLVEVLKDITFRLAPASESDALDMLDSIRAAEILRGVRGGAAVDRDALADVVVRVSELAADFPEIAEVDLNPVFASADGVMAADVRILLTTEVPLQRRRYSREEILTSMRRLMQPRSVTVIGASNEQGKIGNSVMRNLIDGGFPGDIHPVNPKADDILGRKAYKSVMDVPGEPDVAIFAIPAKFVASALEEVGRKGIPNAVLIPSGFAETGEHELQAEIVAIAERHGVRLLGPNIYGYYSTWQDLCATFCTPYDVRGGVALTSQSGGIGMAILGFARTTKTGVSAIVGLGNKSDLDEDDLLTWFGEDPNTKCIAMHLEDLKDGRAFVDAARATVPKKPVVVLKAGRTSAGAKAAGSHTGALAGDDAVYEDILKQSGVIRAPGLNEMLEYARSLPVLPTPKGDNVVIITGAGGSGVLLSDAIVDNGLSLMEIPEDLDAAFKAFIPPFGAAGNPIDITGGEPPSTYEATIRLGLKDPRIHALVLGYWHTIVTPPMVFAELTARVVEEFRERGIEKPVVASLAGDVEVEEACQYLFERGVVAYPYTTEKPVAALGAKYRWARAAGLLGGGR
ncbi:acetate--CoA ligase family protein [Streptomyces lunaelactis]|uniref:acetate--CoA ligase family protein n=1 Tax=Streptomyces lunaelactis TaxID=1535768 RepID=UPI001584CC24|nr:acetate--CoA ligase family protein [Streptomyces lunaelactis]NUK05370.1 acetate--CoA ligase family protein [Streptomyces lunaelactis]NUK38304.1 acetate--CoA ligase family protein [Streptomyces lunaelactis]NUK45319.1 acetate--CoA ligase family protein [Streptomyces lunaelactis]NUK75186.1 acetate--CoA ligase family protein [Streptomyces lunaelactis]NUK95958.1 acetate--CoA ligase family protein [Streptomyces lunaelactis]